jgi:hypothetical protein
MIRETAFVALLAVASSLPGMAQNTEPASPTEQAAQIKQAQQSEPVAIAQDTLTQNGTPAERIHKENPPEPESHGTRLRWHDIPKNVVHDEKAIFTSPFHINRENAKYWAILGGATAVLIGFDQKISDTLPQRTFLTTPSTWASRIGADYSIYPLWAMFYVYGKIGDHPRARDTGRIGIESLIDADITVNILKLATQRPRPENKGDSVKFFKGGDAFPSGHSIKTWALARVAWPVQLSDTSLAISYINSTMRRLRSRRLLCGSSTMSIFSSAAVCRCKTTVCTRSASKKVHQQRAYRTTDQRLLPTAKSARRTIIKQEVLKKNRRRWPFTARATCLVVNS